MAGVFTNNGKNAMLDYLAGEITEISLHDDDPSTTGANELTGGSPAYARKVPSFASASNGEVALSAPLEFDVPAGATVAWVGYWVDSDFVAKGELASSETFGSQGKFTLTTANKLIISNPS